MTHFRRIEVTYSTMGQANPHLRGAARDYVWNGDPAKSEAARKAGRPVAEDNSGQGTYSHQRREARLVVFAAALEEQLARGVKESPAIREAGKACGVGPDTARSYWRLLRQRQETGDG